MALLQLQRHLQLPPERAAAAARAAHPGLQRDAQRQPPDRHVQARLPGHPAPLRRQAEAGHCVRALAQTGQDHCHRSGDVRGRRYRSR